MFQTQNELREKSAVIQDTQRQLEELQRHYQEEVSDTTEDSVVT